MPYSKLQFVHKAMAEIGIAQSQFQLPPEDIQDAVATLDAMMAEWNGWGIRVQYPVDDPEWTDWSTPTMVPDRAWQAIITNLALRLAPAYGKTPMPSTMAAARNGYNLLLARRTGMPQMQLPGTMPQGAGNKPWRYWNGPFINPPQQEITAGPDSLLEPN